MKRLVFANPIGWMLRGFYIESSAYRKEDFYLWCFVQPLYDEDHDIVFSQGKRLKSKDNGWGWKVSFESPQATIAEMIETCRSEGLPILSRVSSPLDFANLCEVGSFGVGFEWSVDDINVLERAAYSWLLAGYCDKAIECLRRIRAQIGHNEYDWIKALDQRAKKFLDWLENGNETAALVQLEEWRTAFAKALTLTDFL